PTLAPYMANREIGMDPREGASCSPPARGDPVPTTSQVSLVPEEARDKRPPVPIVPPPETGEQGMREEVQLLPRMVSIHE
ncbi:hypothetical protein H5410_061296, partial [Solanum commersonii]